MWRSGGNTRLLRKRLRVRFPHSANICVHAHVCTYWVWVFLCIIHYFTKKNVFKVYINPLSRIHTVRVIANANAIANAFASTLTVGGRKWCDWVPGPASFGENH
jgi:hypothetical protein